MGLVLTNPSVQIGKSMHADGLLKGATAISGATVNLQVTLPNGTTAFPMQGPTDTTDGSGTFAMDYAPIAGGAFAFTAIFLGNSQYNGTSISISFFAVAQPQQVVIPDLIVSISTSPSSLHSGEISAITVSVTNGTNPVNGATVSLSSDNGGTFSSPSFLGSGDYVSTFTAPMVVAQKSCYIIANVTMAGYNPGTNETDIVVSPVPPTVPSAPTLSSISPGNTQAILTWTAPSNNGGSALTGYKIYRSTVSGGEMLLTALDDILTYTDTSLTNGWTYYYKISAVNTVGEGAQSNELNAKPFGIPGAPQNLQARPGDAFINLTWQVPSTDNGSSITNYQVWMGSSSGAESFSASVGLKLWFNDTDLTDGQSYYFEVRAENAQGLGPCSNEVPATPSQAATVASAPRNLSATPGNAQVTLIWSAPSSDGGASISNYNVYRGGSSGGETLLATLGNLLIYTDLSLTNGQTYYYKVSAINSVGEGPKSSEASATPVSVPSASTLAPVISGNGQGILTWTAPSTIGGSSITNYRIYRGTASGGETLLTTLGNVLTYTDTGLTNGQTYYYMVSAVNSQGEGPKSNEVSFAPATTPSPPTLSSATPGNAQAILTWTAPSNNGGSALTGYKIYRSTVSGGETLLTTLGSVLNYTDTNLTNGQMYYYKVSAVNVVGRRGVSNELSVTPATVPTAPTLNSPTPGNAQMVLSWSAPSSNGGTHITGYKVYRRNHLGR